MARLHGHQQEINITAMAMEGVDVATMAGQPVTHPSGFITYHLAVHFTNNSTEIW